MKLTRISRIVRLLTTLQSGQCYSVDEMMELVGVSRRTIFRDLKELSNIGVPYFYDQKEGGYRLDPDFFLPSVDLNLQEALSLLILIHKDSGHLPRAFRNPAMLGGLKIENNLPAEIRRYCNATLKSISVSPESQTRENTDHKNRNFWLIQKAIGKKRYIKMEYHSLYDGGNIFLNLQPYHLMFKNRGWYLIGKSSIHNEIRTFKVSRIISLEVLDKCFVPDEPFDLEEYIGSAWSMIKEGNIYNIRLKFSKKVAKNVSEIRWHKTQKTEFNDDGTLTAEFRVDGLGEVIWWVLGYGDQVEVLAPKGLREKVVKIAEKIAKINK